MEVATRMVGTSPSKPSSCACTGATVRSAGSFGRDLHVIGTKQNPKGYKAGGDPLRRALIHSQAYTLYMCVYEHYLFRSHSTYLYIHI